jgi:hypothetical protein
MSRRCTIHVRNGLKNWPLKRQERTLGLIGAARHSSSRGLPWREVEHGEFKIFGVLHGDTTLSDQHGPWHWGDEPLGLGIHDSRRQRMAYCHQPPCNLHLTLMPSNFIYHPILTDYIWPYLVLMSAI